MERVIKKKKKEAQISKNVKNEKEAIPTYSSDRGKTLGDIINKFMPIIYNFEKPD